MLPYKIEFVLNMVCWFLMALLFSSMCCLEKELEDFNFTLVSSSMFFWCYCHGNEPSSHSMSDWPVPNTSSWFLIWNRILPWNPSLLRTPQRPRKPLSGSQLPWKCNCGKVRNGHLCLSFGKSMQSTVRTDFFWCLCVCLSCATLDPANDTWSCRISWP